MCGEASAEEETDTSYENNQKYDPVRCGGSLLSDVLRNMDGGTAEPVLDGGAFSDQSFRPAKLYDTAKIPGYNFSFGMDKADDGREPACAGFFGDAFDGAASAFAV